MRIYPPVPLNARKAKNDYRLPGTDVVIERGTKVVIPVRAIHLDPEYYPNPDKFDPERFSSDEKKKRNIMTWLAFGDGPRNWYQSLHILKSTDYSLKMCIYSYILALDYVSD